MDNSKIYYDSEGNERTIWQMIQHEPLWAANRLQEGEKAVNRVTELENMLADVVDSLGLSGAAMVNHGPLGTSPAELVRLVIEEKDRQIAILKAAGKITYSSYQL